MKQKRIVHVILGLVAGIYLAACQATPPSGVPGPECRNAWSCKVSRAGLMMVATDPTASKESRDEAWDYIGQMDGKPAVRHRLHPE